MQAEHDTSSFIPTPTFVKLNLIAEFKNCESWCGDKTRINVISANFITKAKSTFAQAFASFAPALA